MRSAGLALLMALLAACGGGGGHAAPPPERWRPAAGDTWHWQLQGRLDLTPPVRIFDIDLFDTPAATIAALQARGHRVLCYFSAGSAEDWRADHAGFATADLGRPLDGWAGERWLDTRSATVRAVMVARLERARRKGCDGVEPDNVDAWTTDTGFALDTASQLDYNRFLAREAHARGLAVALKNDVAQVAQLEPDFDLAVNEQCHEFDECAAYRRFVDHAKPVLNAEYAARYRDDPSTLCRSARAAGLRTLVLPRALDGSFRLSCD